MDIGRFMIESVVKMFNVPGCGVTGVFGFFRIGALQVFEGVLGIL